MAGEEARRKVLDDEVIQDFREEFVRLGLPKVQAMKQAEKRLWMLEHLHYQGLAPEEASQCVIAVERELKRSVTLMLDEEKLVKYISCIFALHQTSVYIKVNPFCLCN